MVVERKFIQDLIIKWRISKYMESSLMRAGFSRVEIQKTPVITRITPYVMNPGRVIGRGGETIDALTDTMKKRFSLDNPQISVAEVSNAKLEPRLVAKSIADALERGINPRRLIHTAIKEIMQNGALGAEIIAKGKLASKGARAKKMKVRLGYLPKSGNSSKLVDMAQIASYPKYGAIGVTVRIVQPGTKFPDRDVKKVDLPKNIAASEFRRAHGQPVRGPVPQQRPSAPAPSPDAKPAQEQKPAHEPEPAAQPVVKPAEAPK
ncbi:MAG: 30S ribosomal protein S3 [Candidatus Marsarchaeota archaeon]|nr:30S ribosomal protein S3 [Candidatus Marsarchaeota archaeon]